MLSIDSESFAWVKDEVFSEKSERTSNGSSSTFDDSMTNTFESVNPSRITMHCRSRPDFSQEKWSIKKHHVSSLNNVLRRTIHMFMSWRHSEISTRTSMETYPRSWNRNADKIDLVPCVAKISVRCGICVQSLWASELTTRKIVMSCMKTMDALDFDHP